MKRNPASATWLYILLSAMAVSAAMLAFTTAFSLPMQAGILVVIGAAVTSVGGAYLASFRRGWWWLIGVTVAAVLVGFWCRESGKAVVNGVMMMYSEGYGWYYHPLETHAAPDAAVVIAACFLGGVTSFAMARRWPPLVAIGVAVIPLTPCFMVLHTVPHVMSLFVLVAVLVTYLLAASGTKQPLTAKRTAVTALCVLAMTSMLFVLIQPDAIYNRRGERRDQWLAALGWDADDGGDSTNHTLYQETPTVKLSEMTTPSTGGDTMVMKLHAQEEDILYLREQIYDVYTSETWTSQSDTEDWLYSPVRGDQSYYVFIETPEPFYRQFVPYTAENSVQYRGGKVENFTKDTEFTWRVVKDDGLWRERIREVSYDHPYFYGYAYEDEGVHLELPEETQRWAQKTLAGILNDTHVTNTDKADAVAAFVRNSAAYEREVDNTAFQGGDFAKWFIETQDSGNCVHFSTATAVLLRAAGVPTRYVTGYLAETAKDQWIAVVERDAHAWVEYYEPTISAWVLLESSPMTMFSPEAEGTTTVLQTVVTTSAASTTLPTTVPTSAVAPIGEQSSATKGVGVIFGMVGVIAVLFIQRAIRLAVRRRRKGIGTPNQRAHYYWVDILRLSKALGESPPETAKALADKAKFSQHTLTDRELAMLRDIEAERCQRVRQHPWYKKPWDRLVLALY